MRHFLILIPLFAFFAAGLVSGQGIVLPGDSLVTIHFPQHINPEELRIRFYMKGPFGGYGSFVQTKSNVRDYEIPTASEGKSAETLKLIVSSRKYRTEIFDFPTLDGQKKRIEIKPKALKTVSFAGKVLLQDQSNAEDLQLRINYTPSWECEFFQLSDCLLGSVQIASVNLEKDGSFKVDLPDFAGEKIFNTYSQGGEFSFSLQNKQTGKLLFRLKPKAGSKGFGKIQAALSYPDEYIFISEPEK
jgi:hypothetical protein